MSDIKYDSTSVIDLDFPGFDEYDIVTGSDYRHINEEATGNVDEDLGCREYFTQTENSLELWRKEWETLFSSDINIDELRKKSLAGELRSSYFRSICWRCLLGILHSEPKQWLLELTTYRTHYHDLWVELRKNPWNVERSPLDNPLSQETESIWQKYFSNEELKAVIHQDVVRTFPGVAFFREEKIQDLMVRILFCYARQNPSLCYRQGMHEILAPLIYVLHHDYQTTLLHCKNQNPQTDIFGILNPEYIEEDAYSIFKHIMNHIESSYRIKNVAPASNGYFTPQVDDEKNCENEVITRLQYIKDHILKASDPDVRKHLDELDIPLQLFGIRWLRLLFGREFPFQDLLVLWDAIFAISNLELVNYIVVSMLTAIRPILLNGDYMTCLTNLMRYPSGVDVMFVIQYALHLMNPSVYAIPTVSVNVNKPVILIERKKNTSRTINSENDDSTPEHSGRLKNTKATKLLSTKYHPLALAGSGDGEGSIVEGFTLDDPKVLRSDLEIISMTMEVVHAKLTQYSSILHCNLKEPLHPNVKQALDGISELCSLMKTYKSRTVYSNIEPALEAGESKQSLPPKKKTTEMRRAPKLSNEGSIIKTLPKTIKKVPAGELQVFKQCLGGQITGAPMTDPLRSMRTSCDTIDNLEIISSNPNMNLT